jgi:hypothetical protein
MPGDDRGPELVPSTTPVHRSKAMLDDVRYSHQFDLGRLPALQALTNWGMTRVLKWFEDDVENNDQLNSTQKYGSLIRMSQRKQWSQR